MGSFCKSGPSKTESTNTFTPAGLGNLNEIYAKVRDAASTPYSPYSGQMVAGLNQTQQGGIDNITGATSYLDTARDYATSGASEISEGDIARYYNPFQRDVIEATQRNFAEGNAQQDERLKGNAIAAGAWGGDRAGVARSELMRQQKIAQDPVIAGMNSQGFNLALSAAQADRAAKAQGGYQFGALGNAALAQGQSQIGAGSLEQGTEQQRLNALYQQYQQAQAFPYQQAQFMSQYGTPAVNAMGGTSQGQSQSWAAQPSMLQMATGLGSMALGAFGNPFSGMMGGMGGGGGGMVQNGGISTYSGSGPFYANGGRVGGYNHGGRVRPRDHSGFADTVRALRHSMRRGGAVIDMGRNSDGIYVPTGYADGGDVGFNDRFGAANDAIMSGEFDPQGANYYDPSTPIASVPLPMPRPEMADMSAPMGLPPQIMNPGGGGGQPIMMPPSAMGYDQPAPAGGLRAPMGLTTEAPPEPMPSSGMPPFMPGRSAPSGGGLSEEARMGLIAAGLGILGSRNPSGVGAIGEGGLAGMKVYTQGKESRQKNELAARKLIMDAEQFAKGHDLRKETLGETKRYHDMASDDRRDAIAERRRAAQDRSQDRADTNARTAYPGEGQDGSGNTVKGLYQYNPDTREYDFKPGKVIQKGGSGTGATGQTERLISELRKENPTLTYQEALALTKRAPNGDQSTLRRESLALSAAKADLEYLRDPENTLTKWRKQYGLGEGGSPAAPAAPSSAAPSGKKEAAARQMPPEILGKAKEAIAAGKDAKAVDARLREYAKKNGLEFSGL